MTLPLGQFAKMLAKKSLMLTLAVISIFSLGYLYRSYETKTQKYSYQAVASNDRERQNQFQSEWLRLSQYHRNNFLENENWSTSNITKTLSLRETSSIAYEHAVNTSTDATKKLSVGEDFYGTGSEAHHRGLKDLGFESTSKHSFKSPYIRDPHIYGPDTIRKAPGVRKIKTISCTNCPERFYTYKAHNLDFKSCPYSECLLTRTSGYNPKADVMIFAQGQKQKPPTRHKDQVWIFLGWEPPPRRSFPRDAHLWLDKFNWTISYSLKADFFYPYDTMSWRDSTLLKPDDFYLEMAKRKSKTATWWVSHCNSWSHREIYVREMQKYIDIDIFGACTNKTCEHAHNLACHRSLNDTYRFYLGFENSFCQEYVTEKFLKLFRYRDNIIPVVRGSFNYKKYFPPNILVNAEDFDSPKSLALYLKDLGNDHKRYAEMLKEKDRLGTQTSKIDWCDFCEKLHTGQFPRRVIHDVKKFTNGGGKCWDKAIKTEWPDQ